MRARGETWDIGVGVKEASVGAAGSQRGRGGRGSVHECRFSEKKKSHISSGCNRFALAKLGVKFRLLVFFGKTAQTAGEN